MAVVSIPKDRWRIASDFQIVIVRCPECDQESTLCSLKGPGRDGHSGHRIDDEGNVQPSIVCPHNGCSWHVWGKLEEWDG